MQKRLYRSKRDRMIGGVCGGLGEYLNVDPTLVRLLTVLATITAIGPLVYFVAWIIMPENPDHF